MDLFWVLIQMKKCVRGNDIYGTTENLKTDRILDDIKE